MHSILKWILIIVGIILVALFFFVFVVNLIYLDRDNLAPEWIQSCLGIYPTTFIYIFVLKWVFNKTRKNDLNELSKIKSREKKLVAPINEESLLDESRSESRMTLEPNAVLRED
jgi:protein-S-isoprenylcysteine O-methyltransferase Ste14